MITREVIETINIDGVTLCVEHANYVMIEQLKLNICIAFDISIAQFNSSSKREAIPEARKVFSWICYHVYRKSKSAIGKHMGRDHSTVINQIKQMQNMIDTNDEIIMPKFRTVVKALSNERI